MSNRVTEELLAGLFKEVVDSLRDKIREGSASAQDVRNAISILKDNGIQMELTKDNELDQLARALPDLDFDTDDQCTLQ
jgi:hypothetical protein